MEPQLEYGLGEFHFFKNKNKQILLYDERSPDQTMDGMWFGCEHLTSKLGIPKSKTNSTPISPPFWWGSFGCELII